jgi:antirestriction protein ArdC
MLSTPYKSFEHPAYAAIIDDDFENSAAYLKGWLDVLRVKDNKRWLLQAASEAQKAADHILRYTRK